MDAPSAGRCIVGLVAVGDEADDLGIAGENRHGPAVIAHEPDEAVAQFGDAHRVAALLVFEEFLVHAGHIVELVGRLVTDFKPWKFGLVTLRHRGSRGLCFRHDTRRGPR